ncbi:hypothetical protein BH23GEM10_BH23GEM10_04610 [soil metagenome]
MRTQRRAGILVLFVVVVAALAATPRAEPVAVMIQLTGKVEIEKAGKAAAATVGAALEPGDRLLVADGGKAVLMYRTGEIETATSTRTIAARQSEQVGNVYRQTMQTIAQVATTDAARQPNRQGMIRPVPGEPAPISPRNGISVQGTHPSFTWFAVPGASSYMIQLRRTDEPGHAPMRFGTGTDTTWSLPAERTPLVRGASYSWTVAPAGGRPAREVSFRVLDTATHEQLTAALAGLTAAGADPAGDGLFIAALAYRDAGLYYEADRALARLAGTDSGSGRTFFLLRGEVFDRLGDLDAASVAFRTADAGSGS